jgi:hypothetical protein
LINGDLYLVALLERGERERIRGYDPGLSHKVTTAGKAGMADKYETKDSAVRFLAAVPAATGRY